MSADTTEQNAANGEELRERYLPVSRKELRRRREAELAAQREAGEAPAPEEELAQDEPHVPGRPSESSSESGSTAEVGHNDEAQDELARAVSATIASESDELPEEPGADDDPEDTPESRSDEAQESSHEGQSQAEVLDFEEDVSAPAVLPEPEEEPARPEEEIADAEADLVVDDEDVTQVMTRVPDLVEEEPEPEPSSEEVTDAPAGDQDQAESDSATAEVDPDTLPESRRVRRMLRETQSIPPLSPELLAELDSTNAEIARVDDPTSVDPELLKRQQALAAKAMQANQERMRKEHAKAEKDRRRRSRERPESQILTQKMVRDSLEQDPEDMQYATGQIEPVQARGAHGLDLNKMIDATSRQVDRQKVLMWTVIVMAVLLLAAIAAVVYFVFL